MTPKSSSKLSRVLSFDRIYMHHTVNDTGIAHLATVYAVNMNTAHALGTVMKNVIETEHLVLEDEERKQRGDPPIIDHWLLENDPTVFQGILDLKKEMAGGQDPVRYESPPLNMPDIIERAERSRSSLLRSGIESLCNSVHNEAWVALEVLRKDLSILLKERVNSVASKAFMDWAFQEIDSDILLLGARHSRHLRLHRAGVIDESFIKAMEAGGVAAGVYVIGDRLSVSGDDMLYSINACIHFSRKMLKEAEKLLT